MYKFYLGKLRLPVPPSSMTMTIKNQNKTVNLTDATEVNILKQQGLTEFSFSILVPSQKQPFIQGKFKSAETILKTIKNLKTKQKPFQFIVSRNFPNGKPHFGTNMRVSLESYTVKESAEDGFDLIIEIKLKKYIAFGTKKVKIKTIKGKKVAVIQKTRDASSAPQPKTVKVKRGDTLQKIAQKVYGDANRWGEIYEANKTLITKANTKAKKTKYTLHAGQTLKIPWK